ncbi:MAG TPA: adenylate/guanylate cyclase domain-containing protein, partial [Methylomirabilota bacterium]|nr:adenylate/guanylate cyclase domain-containing protein [Methylomirabilota bacterium]
WCGATTTTTTAPPVCAPTAQRRRLTTLFVDIAGSTSLLAHHPPEAVLHAVQCFTALVSEAAVAHGGTVKDYEGDGALLCFADTGAAVAAALQIRRELAAGRCDVACDAGPGVRARMSLTVGDVVVGPIGSPARPGIALIGPSVNVGARLLKHVGEGGVIASGEVVEALRLHDPALATRFTLRDTAYVVPGGDGLTVTTYEA